MQSFERPLSQELPAVHEWRLVAGQRHSQFVNRQSDGAVALGWYCIAQGSNG
jgi:hypothetical protein